MQVHEAAAVVESGGDAGEQRNPLPYRSSSASGVRGTESRIRTEALDDRLGRGSPLDASIAAALHHRSCLMHLNE